MNPNVFLVIEVEVATVDGAAVVETTEEIGLMDHR